MRSIDKDERLLPLPNIPEMNLAVNQETPSVYAPFYDDENFSQGRSIREYFLVIYKKLPLIIALTILVTAAVAFYMYRQPSLYQSETIMVIEPPKPKPQQGNNVFINNYQDNVSYYNTQIRLLKNPDLMKEVVTRLQLYNNPNLLGQPNKGFFASIRSAVSGEKNTDTQNALPTLSGVETGVQNIALTPEQKILVDQYSSSLLGGLTVNKQEGTNLVTISAVSTNPELAPKIADTVAKVFIEQDARRAVQGAENTYEDLSKSIEELKSTIAAKEAERIAEMQRNGLPLTGEKGNDFNAERLSTLSSQYLQAADDRRKIQAEYEGAVAAARRGEIMSIAPDSSFTTIARTEQMKRQAELDAQIEELDKKIAEAEAKKSQLLVRYTPEYSEVKQAEAQIKVLTDAKNKLQNEGTAKVETESNKLKNSAEKEILTGLQARLSAAQRREEQLRAAYGSAISTSNLQGQAQTRLMTLTNEIETQRNLLNTFTQNQKQMELTIAGSRPENITISSFAQESQLIGPQRNRNIILAFLLSLGFGVGLALLLDYLDDSIKTSDDVGKNLALPTLAVIPHESTLGRKKALSADIPVPTSTALISISDTRSALAEAYRHLRTSLLFSSAGKPPQTILVTSSQPSEGKTTTATNLAVTLAQSGADVVIIDCDLRRPRLHNHFGMDNSVGLTNYLSGEKNPENMLKPFPQLPRLKVITSGPIPPNPAELLSSAEMKNFLTYLKGQFDHVIVDSPPAISFTDAAVLSTLVDGVVLVAMSGKSSAQLLRRFKQRMSAIGTKIFGVVLNGVKPDSYEYGYYGYGYEYSYYDDNDQTTAKLQDEIEVERAKH